MCLHGFTTVFGARGTFGAICGYNIRWVWKRRIDPGCDPLKSGLVDRFEQPMLRKLWLNHTGPHGQQDPGLRVEVEARPRL